MRTGFLRALLGWLARAFATAKSTELPELRELLGIPPVPEWRKRQLLGPHPGKTLVPGWFASRVMREDNARWNAGDVRARIDKAVRNAVAVGFRRYHRLAA